MAKVFLPGGTLIAFRETFCTVGVIVGMFSLSSDRLRADSPHPLVTGAFIQITHDSAARDGAWWQKELASMAEIGMDTVVVQYVASNETYFYPSKIAGVRVVGQDAIKHILDGAQEAGIDVFLGLQLDQGFWLSKFSLSERLKLNQVTLDELVANYSTHKALAGWYLPEEIDDFLPRKKYEKELLSYFVEISRYAKRGADLPIMISPFFSEEVDAEKYARWWDEVAFPVMQIDILAMQDGVGTHRNTLEQAKTVVKALQPIAQKHGVRLWANNESFDQIHGLPVDNQPWAASPAKFKDFQRQVQSSSPFVEKSITFEFTHYLSPQADEQAKELYRDYQFYYKSSKKLPASRPSSSAPVKVSIP